MTEVKTNRRNPCNLFLKNALGRLEAEPVSNSVLESSRKTERRGRGVAVDGWTRDLLYHLDGVR